MPSPEEIDRTTIFPQRAVTAQTELLSRGQAFREAKIAEECRREWMEDQVTER